MINSLFLALFANLSKNKKSFAIYTFLAKIKQIFIAKP